MSMAGTPKAIARKAHTKAVAVAQRHYGEAIRPAYQAYMEAIRPHQEALQKAIADADADYFAAVGRKQVAA